MNEILLPVADAPGYFVSDFGIVYSIKARRSNQKIGANQWGVGGDFKPLKPRPTKAGHLKVILYVNRQPKNRFIHQLVLTTFGTDRPTPTHECRHLDGIPSHNFFENLDWGTKSDNYSDRIKHGSAPLVNFGKGESHLNAKLTGADVLAIRARVDSGETLTAVAADYPVSKVAVRYAARRLTWKHLP